MQQDGFAKLRLIYGSGLPRLWSMMSSSSPDSPEQPHEHRLETRLSHAGCDYHAFPDCSRTPPHLPNIQMSVNFAASSLEDVEELGAWGEPGYQYARLAEPTGDVLKRELALLEGGGGALVFGSGMGAVSATLLGLMRAGDHLLASGPIYSGSRALIDRHLPRFGIEVTYFDPTAPVEEIAKLVRPNTKVIFGEPLTNPLMVVTDVGALARLARERDITLVMDNTLTPPPLCRPLAMGAHVVIHSLTKYINGHGDVLGGCVVAGRTEILRIRPMLVSLGASMPATGSYLVMRGLRTMPMRVRQASATALELARWLEGQPQVQRVLHPGLASHPQHRASRAQFGSDCPGAVFSFEVRGGEAAVREVLRKLRIFSFAASLGEPNSLVEYPSVNQYGHLTRDAKRAMGIPDGLLRLAVGLEHVEDLEGDLAQALSGL